MRAAEKAEDLKSQQDSLLAEVHVRNEDLGFVSVHQSVMLKVAAYPFQRYGLPQGTVLILAPDAQTAAAGSPVAAPANYEAVVRLEKQYLDAAGYGRQKLESGTQLVTEIKQGSRSVLEYLLSPVQRVVLEAGRER